MFWRLGAALQVSGMSNTGWELPSQKQKQLHCEQNRDAKGSWIPEDPERNHYVGVRRDVRGWLYCVSHSSRVVLAGIAVFSLRYMRSDNVYELVNQGDVGKNQWQAPLGTAVHRHLEIN